MSFAETISKTTATSKVVTSFALMARRVFASDAFGFESLLTMVFGSSVPVTVVKVREVSSERSVMRSITRLP